MKEEGTKEYDALFVKPIADGLMGMETLLKSLDKRFHANNSATWTTLYFIGDSLSSDHAMAAVCKLYSLGYEIEACNSNAIGGDQYGEHDKNVCAEISQQQQEETPVVYFNMVSSSNPKRIRIKYLNLLQYSGNETNIFLHDESGVIVYNWGVWANSRDEMREHLSSHFANFYTRTDPNQFIFTWREHEPQHFDTAGGVYKDGVGGQCKDLDCYDNFRNVEVGEYFERTGLLEKIPIVRIFDALIPLHEFHYAGDCTHYCYSPWRFDVTWHGIAYSLS